MYYLELEIRALKEKVNNKTRKVTRQEVFYETWFLSKSKEVKEIDTNTSTWRMMCKRVGVDPDKWKVTPNKILSYKELEDGYMWVGNKRIDV